MLPRFSDLGYIPFSCVCAFFQPVTFGLIILDFTAKIMCASANIKPMIHAKQFPDFEIIWVHYQNDLEGLGYYHHPSLSCFRELKYNLRFEKCT